MEEGVGDLLDLETNPETTEDAEEKPSDDQESEEKQQEKTENNAEENIAEDEDIKTEIDPEIGIDPDPNEAENPTDDTETSGLLVAADTNDDNDDTEVPEIPQVVTVYDATEVAGHRAIRSRDDEDLIMKEKVKPKKQAMDWIAMIGRFFFSHIGLMILSMVYANVGANLYISLELPSEELRYEIKKNTARDIEDRMRYMAYAYWIFHNSKNFNYNETAFADRVETDVRSLIDVILTGADSDGYDGSIEGWSYDWSYAKALLFTITIMTTVGYGHISPKTFYGRLFTIPYSMVGIAIMMVFMARIGDAMAEALKYLYSRFCCRPCRSKRRVNEYPPGFSLLRAHKTLVFDEVGEEDWMPTDTVIIPVIINIMVILGFVFIGTALFNKWEGWDMGSATYFSFITLTTIGFGDMVPEKSFEVDMGDFGSFVKMGIACTYCVLGMSLLAMCISLIQEGMTLKAANMAKKMGIGKSAKVTMDVITVKNKRADMTVDEDEKAEDIASTPDVVVVPTVLTSPQTRPATAATIASVPGAVDDGDDMEGEDEGMDDNEDEGMDDNEDEINEKDDEDNLIDDELDNMDDDMD